MATSNDIDLIYDNARFRVAVKHKRDCPALFALHVKRGKLVAICPDCGPVKIHTVDDSQSSTGSD